jgi:hypothetical protein
MARRDFSDAQGKGVLVSLVISVGMIALALFGVWLWQMLSSGLWRPDTIR